MRMRDNSGVFTISLDFELFWGLRDIYTLDECRERLEGARNAIPKILDLFEEFGIHATWATVGFLFYSHKQDLLNGLPDQFPVYKKQQLNPYESLRLIGNNEEEDPYHYAPSLIQRIVSTEGQEIASHTFSHYYCLEDGQTLNAFRFDIEAANNAALKLGIELKSLVFPRNQCNQEYLTACREAGFISYRGNPRSWLYAATSFDEQSTSKRVTRLVDSYLNISGQHCHDLSSLSSNTLVEIPASRFLRPYMKQLSGLESLRLHRIERDLDYAATNGLLYHLWWHPHNFGTDTDENLSFLRSVLTHYQQLSDRLGMCSLNMAEVAEQVISSEANLLARTA